MKENQRRAQSGFTMIEMMIVVAIIGVMVLPMFYLEVTSSEQINGGIFRREMTEAGMSSVEWISKDFRAASSILQTFNGNTLASDRLILAQDDNSTVVYAYHSQSKKMIRTQYPPGGSAPISTMAMAQFVDSFKIDPVDVQARQISIQLEFSRGLLSSKIVSSAKGIAVRRVP